MKCADLIGWRTFGLCMLGFIMILITLWVCLEHKDAVLFNSAVTGICVLVGLGAGRNAVSDLANGGGIAGAAKVLFTEAKPPPPAP